MKTVKHLCFTSHREAMMRNPKDVGTMLNLLALNSWRHNIQILADCEMSTHVHLVVIGNDNDASAFIKDVRRLYTRHMIDRYNRPKHLRFGEKGFFKLDVYGNNHIQSALSYVLRNPLHHGVAGTPFEYQYSSVNDIFPVEMGKTDRPRLSCEKNIELRLIKNGKWCRKEDCRTHIIGNNLIEDKQIIAGFLPRQSEWPDEWKMSEDGIFLRPCFEELKQTEMQYVSPSGFQFCMFRKSDDNWLQEQKQDGIELPPVQLSSIEPFSTEQDVSRYLANEKSGTFRKTGLNDFEVCRIVDQEVVPAYRCNSVYELSVTQKDSIRRMLVQELHISEKQAVRCIPET